MDKFPTLELFAQHISAVQQKTEVIKHHLYDEVEIEPHTQGLQYLHFFRQPIGWGGNKSLIQTNMLLSCQLPKPQAFWVQSVCLTSAIYSANVFNRMYFEFVIGQKPYFSIAPASAIYRMPEGALDGKEISPGLGLISERNFHATASFVTGYVPEGKLKVRCVLGGYLFRPVV